MKSDLEKAKSLLRENGEYTCVLCKGDTVYKSTERGVKPLIAWVDAGMDFRGFQAADRIVGKAAALLYALLGVDSVYAPVMSVAGYDILRINGIEVDFDALEKEILSRANTGICPMEETVRDITDPSEGLSALKQRIAQMMAK